MCVTFCKMSLYQPGSRNPLVRSQVPPQIQSMPALWERQGAVKHYSEYPVNDRNTVIPPFLSQGIGNQPRQYMIPFPENLPPPRYPTSPVRNADGRRGGTAPRVHRGQREIRVEPGYLGTIGEWELGLGLGMTIGEEDWRWARARFSLGPISRP